MTAQLGPFSVIAKKNSWKERGEEIGKNNVR